MEKIIEWGFDQYAEKIGDISGSATKELQIEIGLKEINDIWEITILEMGKYKDGGHYKIKYVNTNNVCFTWFEYFPF